MIILFLFGIINFMNQDLHLVLKHCWFKKIKSGDKNCEYRQCSEYWNKRFLPVVNGEKGIWKYVVFHDGYTNITIKRKLVSVSVSNKPNDLNLPKVWELKLDV